MGVTLNKRPYTCRNYEAIGDGYKISGMGEAVLQEIPDVSYTDFEIQANVQPMRRARSQLPEGSLTLDRICVYMDPEADGSWAPVRTAEEAGGLPATRLTYNGQVFEVQKIDPSWKHGLIQHLYFEATLLLQQDTTAATSTSDAGHIW